MVGRWIAAYRKENNKRSLQKMDTDLAKLIIPEDVEKFNKTKLVLEANVLGWLDQYAENFRPHAATDASDQSPLFVSWTGEKMKSGQVSRSIQSAWMKSGLGRAITCTLVRKSAVSAVHQACPAEKNNLSDLTGHTVSTASRCYRTVERERTSVEGHKALSRVLGQAQSEMTEEPTTSRLALPQIPEESLREKINRLLQEDDTNTTSEKKFTETEKKVK
ncbi:hypothetical protein SKAU_G00352720 [Synaphobranchus kaupii]|uniref:Uncharacterized protein n=1 Tax=Synaphobranchus kaupii TaxID=118154 RepID=A0A9Q1EKP7_SYNKA|nr:hypothetical protein SKAU_G00352720 [Synaphobranchus kaupii]